MKGIIMLLMLALVPATARSEFFADVFGGRSYTQSGEFSAIEDRELEVPGGVLISEGSLGGSKSGVFGLRGGFWFDEGFRWLGAAGDWSYFHADAQDIDADVSFNSLSFMLMLRYPFLIHDEYPNGRLYPYAGIGAIWALVDIDAPSSLAQGSESSDTGGVFCAGLKWMLSPRIGVFTEFRAISITFDASEVDTNYDFLGRPHSRYYKVEGDVTTHQLLGGVSIHF
jgi:hypothetical protein